MAYNAISFFSFCSLLFVLPMLFQSALAVSKDKKPSPYEFLQHLQGSRKGDKVKDLSKLKKYLEIFGYLNNKIHAHDDDFDELLESAIKTYQLNFHLNPTGILDAQTVSKTMMPRCGVPDIINGTTRMRSGKMKHHAGDSKSIHEVVHYNFFHGLPKWPRYYLAYAFRPGTRSDAFDPVASALDAWGDISNVTFARSFERYWRYADIKISFERWDHGDASPFDGPGGVLAHAFAPTDGRLHFDADETWSVDVDPDAFHLATIALHEIGHLLSLAHTSIESAIMYPSVSRGQIKTLGPDDIEGINTLYNEIKQTVFN